MKEKNHAFLINNFKNNKIKNNIIYFVSSTAISNALFFKLNYRRLSNRHVTLFANSPGIGKKFIDCK